MSSTITVTHERGKRFAAQVRTHRIVTDQSPRSGGEDSAPTPLELLAAALGSCVALYVHQFCASRGYAQHGTRIEVTSRNAANPNRIGELAVTVHLPRALPAHAMEMLERVVRSCPVHNTLVHGAEVSVEMKAGVEDHAIPA